MKIDSDCEDIIGLYTPVAVDLRFVLAMLKINTNLERIADFCEGMSRFVIDYPQISVDAELLDKTNLREMLDTIKKMMEKGKEALTATHIVARYIQDKPDRADECLHLIGIIRKMERIGDHCNNMAEEIIFYLDAKVLKHSTKK